MAHRWVARFDAEGWDGLHDRSSRAHRYPSRTAASIEAAVVATRLDLREGCDRIAERVAVPARTVSRILARHGLPSIASLDPVTGVVFRASKATSHRYERAAPGNLVHVDVKKLGRIPDGGGWRAHGQSEKVRGRGIGFDYVQAVIDDHSRLSYAEIHPDEKGATAAACVVAGSARCFRQRGYGLRSF